MHSSLFTTVLSLAATAAATPALYGDRIGLVTRDAARLITHDDLVAVAESMPLEKRISEDFDLNHQVLNKTIFSGNLASDGTATKITSLKVTCKECSTKGTITAKLTTEHLIKPVVRFDLKGVEATADMDIASTGTLAFTLNLFTSESPLGISVPGIKLGLLFSVDLAFSLTNPLDISGGFHMKLPDDAFFEIDVFDGAINDKLFDGSGFMAIPIQVHSGASTFKADLRLRVDLAASASFKGIGGGGVGAGVFANLAEFVAQLNRTDDCFLQAQDFFDLNVGATASAGIGAGLKTFNVVPGVSTTLLNSPTETQCVLKDDPAQALKPTGTMGGNSTQQIGQETVSSPVVTATAMMRVRDAPTYVITTCVSDIINCPPSLASIITVTETADVQAAAITPAPVAENFAVQAPGSFVYLSALATPVVNSIA